MCHDKQSLASLDVGSKCRVTELADSALNRRRMLDLGIVPGTLIEAVMESPSGSITAYLIRGAIIAIRHKDAENIIIQKSEQR